MGPLKLTPAVNESISAPGTRTAGIGKQILLSHGAMLSGSNIIITIEQPRTQKPEFFTLTDLGKMWNPSWTLERAGYGRSTGGMAGVRGDSYFDADTLAAFHRDIVRGALLPPSKQPSLCIRRGRRPRPRMASPVIHRQRQGPRVLTAQLRRLHARLALPQDPHNLLFTETALLHRSASQK